MVILPSFGTNPLFNGTGPVNWLFFISTKDKR